MNWGPDPELTQVGIDQAIAAREAWKREHAFTIPIPQKHYASPLQRALQTFHETFVNGDPLPGKPGKVVILEVRETILDDVASNDPDTAVCSIYARKMENILATNVRHAT